MPCLTIFSPSSWHSRTSCLACWRPRLSRSCALEFKFNEQHSPLIARRWNKVKSIRNGNRVSRPSLRISEPCKTSNQIELTLTKSQFILFLQFTSCCPRKSAWRLCRARQWLQRDPRIFQSCAVDRSSLPFAAAFAPVLSKAHCFAVSTDA